MSAHFPHKDFAYLIENILELTELDLCWSSSFSSDCWKTLQENERHLRTLTVLKIEFTKATGPDSQAMLCSLPSLEIFWSGRMMDEDIEKDSRPWACRGLKELKLNAVVKSQRQCLLPLILERVAQLTDLESFEFHSGHAVALTLSSGGLNTLRTLRRLKVFKQMPFSALLWGENEVRWTLEYWPELKVLAGVRPNSAAQALLKGVQLYY